MCCGGGGSGSSFCLGELVFKGRSFKDMYASFSCLHTKTGSGILLVFLELWICLPACVHMLQHVNVRAVIFKNVFFCLQTRDLAISQATVRKISSCGVVVSLLPRDVSRLSQLQSNLSPCCPPLLRRRFPFAFVAPHCTHPLLEVKWRTAPQNSGLRPVSSRERLETGPRSDLKHFSLPVACK